MEVREELKKEHPELVPQYPSTTALADMLNQTQKVTNVSLNSQLVKQLQKILKPLGLSVKNRADMEKFFKEHPDVFVQTAVGEIYGINKDYLNSNHKINGEPIDSTIEEIIEIVKTKKYNKSGTDAVIISADNYQTVYTIDHSPHKELEKNLEKGDGFGIRHEFSVKELNGDAENKEGTSRDELIKQLIRDIAADYGFSEARIRKVLQNLGIRPENMLGSDLASELKRMSHDYALVSRLGRGRGYQSGYNLNGKGSRKNQTEIRRAEESLFITSEGEIYGFVDKDGNIYLDETKISPEHPIHEYTHLWDRLVAKKNPKLWAKGIELMKQTSLWNEIENDANYGQLWKSIEGMTDSKLESLIASEVHARLTGESGAEIIDKLAKEKGQEDIIDKLKQWMLDFWKDLKATFSNWSDEELSELTLEDFNNMVVRDFADALDFNAIQEQSQPATSPSKLSSESNSIVLPNYQSYDNSSTTNVDAQWKVPLLQELDACK